MSPLTFLRTYDLVQNGIEENRQHSSMDKRCCMGRSETELGKHQTAQRAVGSWEMVAAATIEKD